MGREAAIGLVRQMGEPSNKGMKLTKLERIGALQLIPGVGQSSRGSAMRRLAGLSIALVLIASAASKASPAEPAPVSCAARSDLVGPCYVVHGRLQSSNGNPSIRIWIVGTKRVLGVAGSEGAELVPKPLVSRLADGVVVYGNFRVCPMTTEVPGSMQSVCVESGSELVREAWSATGTTVTRLPDVTSQR
jgi:hypothetical protein